MFSLARPGPRECRKELSWTYSVVFPQFTNGSVTPLQGVECIKGQRERHSYINQILFTGRKHQEWERNVSPPGNICSIKAHELNVYILFSTYDLKLLEGRNCTLSLFVKAMYLEGMQTFAEWIWIQTPDSPKFKSLWPIIVETWTNYLPTGCKWMAHKPQPAKTWYVWPTECWPITVLKFVN